MGQVFRRAIGRVSRSPENRTVQRVLRDADHLPAQRRGGDVSARERIDVSSNEDISVKQVESNVLEERDPGYDSMLQKMVGTIRSKPGGKPEMGEAFIVQKYRRPLPKIRSSVEESVSHYEKPLLPGTLTIAQLQEILLLHQGKSDEHKAPMDIPEISRRFGVDVAQLEQMFKFLSLPPEHQEKGTEKSN